MSAFADETAPVTVEDVTAKACADRLQKVLDAPPLTLAARGSGLREELSIVPREAAVLDRRELEIAIQFLRKLGDALP